MPRTADRPRLAVLIDAENAYASHAPLLMELIGAYGRATIRRAYGDWTTSQLLPWKKVVNEFGIRPCQQFRYASGKNSSDCAMIMDAMDLLHGGSVDGFCIVSSDSDYTGLATRIQESGLVIYGFGLRHTVRAFASACDEFVYLDAVGSAVN
jgi:NYN domain